MFPRNETSFPDSEMSSFFLNGNYLCRFIIIDVVQKVVKSMLLNCACDVLEFKFGTRIGGWG